MDILILDEFAADYAGPLRAAFPEHQFHEALNHTQALQHCANARVLVAFAHDVSDDLVAAMPHLEWVCAVTTGTDHLNTLRSLKPEVRITSARGIHGPQMSEMAIFYMIALARNFRLTFENQKKHVWQRRPQSLLLGKTVVIVGIGLIAEEMALRFKAFGMTTIGVSDARREGRGFDEIVPRADLHKGAARANYLIALVPYTSATHHMIDASVLSAMPRHGFFINLARGNVVDETALIEHLRDGKIAGAGLDVFATEPLPQDSPLWDMDNVIVTPRIGGMSDVYALQVLPLIEKNLRAFADNRPGDMINIVR